MAPLARTLYAKCKIFSSLSAPNPRVFISEPLNPIGVKSFVQA